MGCKKIDELKENVDGKIVTMQSPEYPEARLVCDPFSSHFPCVIVYPVSESDIKACIAWCQRYNVKFRVRGSVSHSLGFDFSSVNRGLVCNIKKFNQVRYIS